jgi:hypothetical protein
LRVWGTGIDPRIDLVGGIPANHVVEDELAAWVSVFPGIAHSEDVVLEDNDRLAGGDEVLDLAPGVYAGVDHGCGLSMVTRGNKECCVGGRKKEVERRRSSTKRKERCTLARSYLHLS